MLCQDQVELSKDWQKQNRPLNCVRSGSSLDTNAN